MYKFSLKKLTPNQKELRLKIIELSYRSKLSHTGSCLTAVDLIDGIYEVKKKDDKFILSNGHAGVAWYAVLEKYKFIKKTDDTKKLNIHPDRNVKYDIHVSTGSLGQGLPIALGMAIADKTKIIYCMLSDGECTEGSIWEALRVIYEYKIYNLKIVINANGWSAYNKVDLNYLKNRIKSFGFKIILIDGHDSAKIINTLKKLKRKELSVIFAYTFTDQFPFLKGQDAHYYIMDDADYKKALKLLS